MHFRHTLTMLITLVLVFGTATAPPLNRSVGPQS